LSVSVADFFTFGYYELQFPQYLSAEATLPDGFSVAAVPELSTWAMLLIWVRGLCGHPRRRLIGQSFGGARPTRLCSWPKGRRLIRSASGDRPMRALVILALALFLASCNGDRMKGMNVRQAQPQSSGLLT
jgi:hypothetical protein